MLRSMLRPLVTLLFATVALSPVALSGCSKSSTPSLCGPDGHYDEVAGARVCAYAQAIVIEGGFRCPAELPFRLDLEGAAICSDRMLERDDLPEDLCRRIDRTCGGSDGGVPVCYALCDFAGTCTTARQQPAFEGRCPRGFALAGTCTTSACLPGDAGFDSDAGACPSSITEGEACANEGQTCGGPCTDACSFCNLFRCEGGEWTRIEVFPAPCFACGDEGLRCRQDTEYCDILVGGAEPGFESFSCNSDLNTCDGPPTCDCLALSPASTCDDSGDGVIVRTFAP